MLSVARLFRGKVWPIGGLVLLTACASAAVGEELPAVLTTPSPPGEESPVKVPTLLPEEPPPTGAESQFTTDFSRRSVPYTEILSGGPPKDGIPAIDNPSFINVAEADEWLEDVEPVIFLRIGDDARAYPLQIMTWHEIVNDTVNNIAVVVTFCPLCNTAIVFERTVSDRVLDFGTTGRLRYSNLVMYDRQTESWWQQANGEAIAGELTGRRLSFLPATIIGWGEFKANFPEGKVLSRETGFSRPYGTNPYTGYDDINNSPFLYRGPRTPDQLPPIARVLTVDLGGEAVAYPYDVLQSAGVVNDGVGGTAIVVFWQPGAASNLDAGYIADSRDVGAAAAYSRWLDGKLLTFTYKDGRILDEDTGSEWDVLGKAVSGVLAGKQLEPVIAINHFWFSWAAFRPETRIYQP